MDGFFARAPYLGVPGDGHLSHSQAIVSWANAFQFALHVDVPRHDGRASLVSHAPKVPVIYREIYDVLSHRHECAAPQCPSRFLRLQFLHIQRVDESTAEPISAHHSLEKPHVGVCVGRVCIRPTLRDELDGTRVATIEDGSAL